MIENILLAFIPIFAAVDAVGVLPIFVLTMGRGITVNELIHQTSGFSHNLLCSKSLRNQKQAFIASTVTINKRYRTKFGSFGGG